MAKRKKPSSPSSPSPSPPLLPPPVPSTKLLTLPGNLWQYMYESFFEFTLSDFVSLARTSRKNYNDVRMAVPWENIILNLPLTRPVLARDRLESWGVIRNYRKIYNLVCGACFDNSKFTVPSEWLPQLYSVHDRCLDCCSRVHKTIILNSYPRISPKPSEMDEKKPKEFKVRYSDSTIFLKRDVLRFYYSATRAVLTEGLEYLDDDPLLHAISTHISTRIPLEHSKFSGTEFEEYVRCAAPFAYVAAKEHALLTEEEKDELIRDMYMTTKKRKKEEKKRREREERKERREKREKRRENK